MRKGFLEAYIAIALYLASGFVYLRLGQCNLVLLIPFLWHAGLLVFFARTQSRNIGDLSASMKGYGVSIAAVLGVATSVAVCVWGKIPLFFAAVLGITVASGVAIMVWMVLSNWCSRRASRL